MGPDLGRHGCTRAGGLRLRLHWELADYTHVLSRVNAAAAEVLTISDPALLLKRAVEAVTSPDPPRVTVEPCHITARAHPLSPTPFNSFSVALTEAHPSRRQPAPRYCTRP